MDDVLPIHFDRELDYYDGILSFTATDEHGRYYLAISVGATKTHDIFLVVHLPSEAKELKTALFDANLRTMLQAAAHKGIYMVFINDWNAPYYALRQAWGEIPEYYLPLDGLTAAEADTQ